MEVENRMRTFFEVGVKSARILLSSLKDSKNLASRYLYHVVDLSSIFPVFQKVKFYLDQNTSEVELQKESRSHSGGPLLGIKENTEGRIVLNLNPCASRSLTYDDANPETIKRLSKYFLRDMGESSANGLVRKAEFIPLVNPDYQSGNDTYILPNSPSSKDIIYGPAIDRCLVTYSPSWGWPQMHIRAGKNSGEAMQAYIFAQRAKKEMPICPISFGETLINEGYEWNRGNPIVIQPTKETPKRLENELYLNLSRRNKK